MRNAMQPVYVFQMGKVGSTSLVEAVDGIQVHHLHWGNWWRSLRAEYCRHHLNSLRMKLDRPTRIITAVREPVARNISAFMQNHRAYGWQPTMETFLERFRHEEPLAWFDEEMLPFSGIDVFKHPFPHDKGWQVIDDRLLILRAETDDSIKQEVISNFLGQPVNLVRKNVSKDKQYAHSYKSLRNEAPPIAYVDKMLESGFTRHFYSEAEIANFRSYWASRIEAGRNG